MEAKELGIKELALIYIGLIKVVKKFTYNFKMLLLYFMKKLFAKNYIRIKYKNSDI